MTIHGTPSPMLHSFSRSDRIDELIPCVVTIHPRGSGNPNCLSRALLVILLLLIAYCSRFPVPFYALPFSCIAVDVHHSMIDDARLMTTQSKRARLRTTVAFFRQPGAG